MINNKPVFLWPFILVYRVVTFIIKVPILFVRYFCLGFFFTGYFLVEQLVNLFVPLFKYSFLGLLFLCHIVYSLVSNGFKYLFKGLKYPFVYIYKSINSEEAKAKREELKKSRAKKREELHKQQEIKRQEELARKEKIKKEKEEKRVLAEKAKQEALLIKEEKKKEAAEQKRLEKIEKQENKNVAKDSNEQDNYIIHAPKNEILDEEKREEQKEKHVLTKEERKQLKIEKMEAKKALREQKRLEREKRSKMTKEEKQQFKLEQAAARKEARLKRAEEKKKQQEKLNDFYINEDVKIEKLTLGKRISQALNELNHLPDKIASSLQKSWNNSTFVKNKKNRDDMSRQALLINFDGEDAVKSDKKVVYEYVGKNADGKLVKGYFEAFSKVEVHSFLLSEGFEVYSIKTNRFIQMFHGSSRVSKTRIKVKDLIFFLTQLSTYIKAGIPLVDALKILSRQFKNKSYERVFSAIVYDLTMGENFSDALAKQGNAFPRLLINMIKASEMTGELPEALDDMADYYTETDKTRKQMITAMMYPSIIFIISIAAITFIMVFVVPNFVTIYESMDNARLPWITQMVIDISTFMETRMAWIIIGTVLIISALVYLYKKVTAFRTIIQFLVMHIPVFGNVIIYNEVTMFTKTFCSLLRHNVFITDSMEILNKITNNEIYKMIILDTITNLARGEKISLAFKDHWAVPLPAYEMIVTGERTGQLPEMMGKVSAYYQEMHKNAVARIKTFIEPALILFLTVMVGGIVLSIVVPMFDMYNNMGL